jgi:hypothetical protein
LSLPCPQQESAAVLVNWLGIGKELGNGVAKVKDVAGSILQMNKQFSNPLV